MATELIENSVCHGWGLLPLFQNTPMPLLARLRRDVHAKKQMFSTGIAWQGSERLINTPWWGELGLVELCWSCWAPQGSSFSSACNSWLWEYWCSLTNPRTHRFGAECYNSRMRTGTPGSLSWSSHLSLRKNTAPGFNCHTMATLHTCSSTYLLVSNLITIQSRGKTLIFIRFRNTQKIFRRNSCHTGKKKSKSAAVAGESIFLIVKKDS